MNERFNGIRVAGQKEKRPLGLGRACFYKNPVLS